MFNRIDLGQIKTAKNINHLSSLVWNALLVPIGNEFDNEGTKNFREISKVAPTKKNVNVFFKAILQQCDTYKDLIKEINDPHFVLKVRFTPSDYETFHRINAVAHFYLEDYKKAAFYATQLSDGYKPIHKYQLDYLYAQASLIAYLSLLKLDSPQSDKYKKNFDDSMDRVGSQIIDIEGFGKIVGFDKLPELKRRR